MKKSAGGALAALALSLGVMVAPTPAQAAVPTATAIHFDGETAGAKANGYYSAEDPGVLFYDTSGSNLYVGDFAAQSHGLGLEVGADDASALEMRLAAPTTGISLAFGNDDPTVDNVTDQAQLTLYRNSTQVGQVDVNVNANDAMDQTISYTGRLFNRATFQYVDAAGNPKNLIEVVDDVTVNPLCTIAGNAHHNVLVGTSGDDVICGDAGNDRIRGGGGDDLIYPGSGNDHTSAGKGNDVVIDGFGRDRISGGKGNDILKGGPGRDHLSGGKGRDYLYGGGGRDTCNGGSGHDHGSSCAISKRIP